MSKRNLPATTRGLVAFVAAILVIGAIAAPVAAAPPEVKLRPILSGYAHPLLVTNNGVNKQVLFVVEAPGRIHRATDKGGKWRKLGAFLDIRDRVVSDGERGLMGLAFHPRYKQNRRFYVVYTRKGDGSDKGDIVVAEFRRRTRAAADPASERILLVIPQTRSQHIGGHLAFGRDGYLYVAIGDGGGSGDPDENGQDLGTLKGALLRIDPRDPDGAGGRTYRIPPGNPYVGKPGRNEIWAHGLRSPWRYSFDRANGNLWLADVGQQFREEVNRSGSNKQGRKAARKANFGWDDCEADLEFELDEGDADGRCSSHDLPIHAYGHDRPNGWCSVTGGYVYRGPVKQAWRGLYVAGDFCGGVFVLNQTGKRRWDANSGVGISSFGEDVRGNLYATGWNEGTLYQVRLKGRRP